MGIIWNIIYVIFFGYWLYGLIIFRKISNMDDISIKVFYKKTVVIFFICITPVILDILLTSTLPSTKHYIIFFSLWIVYCTCVNVILIWYAFRKGAIIFALPSLSVIKGNTKTKAFLEKQWQEWGTKHRRLTNICLICSIIFAIIPGLFCLGILIFIQLTN